MSTSGPTEPEMGELQRIASAFVHDFNNLFQTALGNLDLLSGRVEDPAAARMVSETIRSVERAVELTERLNLIGNKYPQRFRRINVASAIAAATREIRAISGDNSEIPFRSGATHAECHLPQGQLERALAALLSDGPAAFSRGAPAIETASVEIEAGAEDLAPGTYVRIRVSAENRTTRPLPAGVPASYLPAPEDTNGFLLVRRFATQLNGACRLDADAGGRTQVDLFLPSGAQGADNESGGADN